MSVAYFRVRFMLDGAGLMYDPNEPLHLDGLLARAAASHHAKGAIEAPGRNDTPDDIPLPLMRWHIGGQWGWRASALLPVGEAAETLQFWRCKFRQNRIELTGGSPNLTNATWREYNMPMPLLLCHEMEAFCAGCSEYRSVSEVRHTIRRELLRSVRHLGKKASMGKGVVNDVLVERIEEDYSLLRDGRAMRWLPDPDGTRLVRPRPPYWNNVGRISTCEVGDAYSLPDLPR